MELWGILLGIWLDSGVRLCKFTFIVRFLFRSNEYIIVGFIRDVR